MGAVTVGNRNIRREVLCRIARDIAHVTEPLTTGVALTVVVSVLLLFALLRSIVALEMSALLV